MKSIFPVFLLVLLICISCTTNQKESTNTISSSGWELVFRNDSKGKVVFGDKEKLIDAVRNGYPVRLGFGDRRPNDTTKSVEHVAEAEFLTITNTQEVFAQLKPIVGQNPDLDSLKITFRENLSWTFMGGTNGFSDRLTRDVINDSIVGHQSRPTAISWYVNFPSQPNTVAAPLWDQ